MSYIFTSESVSAGHPDKVCDQISDAVLDAYLAEDPNSRVACETMIKNNMVFIAGEITSTGSPDLEPVVRQTIKDIGYDNDEYGFNGDTCEFTNLVFEQSPDISQGVTEGEGENLEQGAGDQGLMFGYACTETEALMPLPIDLSHRLVRQQAEVMKSNGLSWLRPDAKSQVSAIYSDDGKTIEGLSAIVLSTQHDEDITQDKYRDEQPLAGAKIMGCIHMTIQTAVLMETLVDLGAELRWSSCNIFSTQDHAAAAMAAKGVPVFAWKGETEEEYEWCIEQTICKNGKPWDANMILDDGSDLTGMVHAKFPDMLETIHGVSEETTTGVHRLKEMLEKGELKIPAINVNDSVTKAKNDNKYGCRHSLNDALKRGTDMLLSGKKGLVIGYGDVGKGSAASLAQEGMIVSVVESDPICAMQACMDGFAVVSCYKNGVVTRDPKDINMDVMGDTDLIVTTTGNVNVCDSAMISTLKNTAVVCNIGHFDNEIDTAYMRENYYWDEIKPQVHRVFRDTAPDGTPDLSSKNYIILLAEGRLVNLGNATGHPSRIMDGSFANQVLAQIHLYKQGFANINDADKKAEMLTVEVLPKKLDEEVASLMVEGFGGTVTQLTKEQADYINVPQDGPFKEESYKY